MRMLCSLKTLPHIAFYWLFVGEKTQFKKNKKTKLGLIYLTTVVLLTFPILLYYPRCFLSSLSSASDLSQGHVWAEAYLTSHFFDSENLFTFGVSLVRSERGPCQTPSPLACGVEVHVRLLFSFHNRQNKLGFLWDLRLLHSWMAVLHCCACIRGAVRTHPEWLARGSCLLGAG